MKQISVFLENRPGTLTDILQLLKKGQVNLRAISIADTVDYGICRIVCDDPCKAVTVLKEAGIAASESEITALEVAEDKIGSIADIVSIFAAEGVNLAYLYTFILDGRLIMACRPTDAKAAAAVCAKHSFKTI